MNLLDKIDGILNEKEKNENIINEIFDFFKDNPSPKDSDIHKFAADFKIDTHIFEEIVYSILGSFIGAGRAKKENFTEKDADPKQLKMGITVEAEHTTNPIIAKRIALDHLAEFPTGKYYTNLLKIEKEMENNKK